MVNLVLCECRIQRAYDLIHMLLLCNVRRQETQHRIVRAVDQNALREQLADDGLRSVGRVEVNRQHQSHAANFFYRAAIRFYFLQLVEEIRAQLRYMPAQFIELLQKLNRNSASERSAAKRGSVQAGVHPGRDAVRGQ